MQDLMCIAPVTGTRSNAFKMLTLTAKSVHDIHNVKMSTALHIHGDYTTLVGLQTIRRELQRDTLSLCALKWPSTCGTQGDPNTSLVVFSASPTRSETPCCILVKII